MRVGEPARRHGVADEDIQHAVRNAIREIHEDDMTMLIGPAHDGALLEIGIVRLDDDDDVVVVLHAMPLRQKYYGFLNGEE